MSKVLWICGRPGSGKTTLLNALKDCRPDLVDIDADNVRRRIYPQLGYSDQDRETNVQVLIELACMAALGGRAAAVAAVTPTRNLRILAQNHAAMEMVPFHLIHMEGRSRPLWESFRFSGENSTRPLSRSATLWKWATGMRPWQVPRNSPCKTSLAAAERSAAASRCLPPIGAPIASR